jgi:hypothetical protein
VGQEHDTRTTRGDCQTGRGAQARHHWDWPIHWPALRSEPEREFQLGFYSEALFAGAREASKATWSADFLICAST